MDINNFSSIPGSLEFDPDNFNISETKSIDDSIAIANNDTKTGKKFSKLAGKSNNPQGKNRKIDNQLVYPYDLGNIAEDAGHSGHAVVFMINQTTKSRDNKSDYIARSSGANTISVEGFAGKEVTMQTDDGIGSNRHEVGIGAAGDWGGRYVRTDLSIVLPPPQQWNENFNHSWKSTELGTIRRSGDLMDSIGKAINHGSGNMKGANEALDQAGHVVKDVATSIADKMGISSVGDYIDIESGMNANTYNDSVYQNTNVRTFPFVYNFVPRNEEESQIIHDLLHRFKWASAPEYWKPSSDNTSYMLAPCTFDIFFIDLKTGKLNPFWHKIGTCVLTNMSINRTAQGEYAVMENGQQASISLEMSFTELFTISKSNLENPDESY